MDNEIVLADCTINDAEDLKNFLLAIDTNHAPMYIYLPGSTETVAGILVVEVRLTDGSLVRNLRLLR